MPAFTIITVCLNIASTIRRTCESIVNQTFQDFQWIVIDGASTDGTLDILQEYSSRIDILISEQDKGIYNAMNKGIKLAIGEYINFMNGGDEFFNRGVLHKVYQTGLTNDVVYGNSCYIDGNKKDMVTTITPITATNLYHYYILTHPSCFIKATIQKKYLFNEKLQISADREFFSKLYILNHSFQKEEITISSFYKDGISSNNMSLKTKEDLYIKKKYFKSIYYKVHHPTLFHIYEFFKNSIRHPRYFAGWVKHLIIKQKA